jgi:glycosyltransferase involved in cell wall biosynthesis
MLIDKDKNTAEKTIQIIMSTYNGEKYLIEQLDSIVNMAGFEAVSVLIRDDGSKDGTRLILDKYSRQYGFKVIYGENVGVNRSIWILLENTDPTCKYYAICDQDDVWLPDKFNIALSMIEKEDSSIPLLFGSLSEIVDENLKHLGSTVNPKKGLSYYNAMTQNVTPGHTQVFNRVMVDMLIEKGAENIHVIDWWLYLMASAMGKVVFADVYTVRHRQHGINAVGYETHFFRSTYNRFKSLKSKKGNAVSEQLLSFLERYKDILPVEYRKETVAYFDSMCCATKRIRYAFRCRAYRQQTVENLAFKLLYIIGKYNMDS